ncbi:MAG TPA: PAS domain S-box protein [Gemmatales bacterium]|nr:PAS domain S-box protein [Gemmatales bacterium]
MTENDILRESEERLRLAFWAANIGFWIWDLQTQEVYLSPIWKSQLGYEDHELPNQFSTWESLLNPEDRESSWKIILEAQNNPNRIFEIYFRLRHKDQSYRWILSRGRVYRDEGGKPIRIMGCHVDVTQQKEDERLLRESEAKLRVVLDSGRMGMWVWDMQTGQVSWNEREYELLDLSSDNDSSTVEHFFQVVHPDDRQQVEHAVQKAVQEDRDFSSEFRVIRPNGTIRWLKGAGRTIRDPKTGAPIQMLGVNYDITPSKEAIVSAQEAHEFNRQIIANVQEGIIVYDRALKFRMWNPYMDVLSGVPESEVIGKGLLEAFPLLKDMGVEECLERALKGELVTGKDLYYESPVTKLKGWTTSQYGPWRDAQGRIIGVIATVRDITNRKLAEQRLFDNQQRIELILQQLPSVLWTTDMDLRFTSSSGSGLKEIGQEPNAVAGISLQEFFQTSDMDHPSLAAHRQALQGQSSTYDQEFADRCFHVHLEPLRKQDGAIIGCIGVALDVTERKRQEIERQALEQRVQHAQKLESLEVLAGGIAHDFNNLLTGMLGYANLAQLEVPAESQAAAMIREIEKAAQRAAELSRQMLAYSGKGKFVIEAIRLDQLVVEMAGLLKTIVSPKAQLHIVAEFVTIEGDATQIRQVVMNLITNAADAIQGEGYIAIRTGVRRVTVQEFEQAFLQNTLPDGEYAYLEVQDNGQGMSPEIVRKIFDPFFTTKFTGRGLGLASVLGIVRGHRGSIFVESRPGSGTTFRVVLPCSSRPSPPLEETEKVILKPTSGKILVIEDDQGVLQFVKYVLEAAGFHVLATTDSRQALELVRQHGLSLRAALIDLTMPHINGIELSKILRQELKQLPLLLMSGYSEEEVTPRLSGLRVNGFLHKPFRAQELTTQLTRILSTQATSE